VSVTIDLAKALDKAYEDKSLKDILDASPWARFRPPSSASCGSVR